MAVRTDREQQERLLAMWRELLARSAQLGPVSGSPEDLDAFGEVKDYIIDQIARHEAWLKKDRVTVEKIGSESAQFATPRNPRNNDQPAGTR